VFRRLTAFMVVACGATAQTDAGLDLWIRVREHVRASAVRLPNFSCQETMERTILSPAGQIEFRERLRLEVLFIETTELFAWPGSSEFTSEALESWISAGAINNGDFAAEVLNLFVISAASVRYVDLDMLDQHALLRFDFHMPLLTSKYSLAIHGKSATTAFSGSFWVDRESLDLVRLEMHAEEIPSDLDCREAHQSITYGRAGLVDGDGLLPSAAELAIVSRDGHESRNAIAFNNCRHYSAASTLSFTEPSDSAPPAKSGPQRALPADVELALRLEEPISITKSMAGDQIAARLDKAVHAGGVLLPKGTRVLGRIRRLEQHLSSPPSILVGLQFFAAEAPDGLVAFSARLTGPRASPDVIKVVNNRMESVPGTVGLNIEEDGRRPGLGSFRVPGKELRVERGFRTVWKTQ
jgi:hypothetical protein